MKNKITLSILGIFILLSLYNTYQISIINNDYVQENPVSIQGEIIKKGNKTFIKPAPVKADKKNPFTSLEKNDKTLTKIDFDILEKDFGNVNVTSSNKYSFEFKNTGDEPLIIKSANGSCGCTVPDWPKEAIMPGQKGKIDVVFNPKPSQAGSSQKKTVTVTANTNPVNTVLHIKAFVNKD